MNITVFWGVATHIVLDMCTGFGKTFYNTLHIKRIFIVYAGFSETSAHVYMTTRLYAQESGNIHG